MKTVYFVRHGSTRQLEARAWQEPSVPLSEMGELQAVYVAKRFATIPIDVIISSEMQRALDTAHAIKAVTGTNVIPSPLFHELLRPTKIRGKNREDAESFEIWKLVENNFAKGSQEKHSDEEIFTELRARATKAVALLESRPEESICVVTHGTFLKTMMAVMMGGSEVGASEAVLVYKFFFPSNTGITTCTFEPTGWLLRTWNDDAHLGEIKE